MNALLLLTYACLRSIDDIAPFYTHLYHGSLPSNDTIRVAKERFRSIGTVDPLSSVTTRQAAALEKKLNHAMGPEIKIYQATKHTAPFVPETIKQIITDGADRLFTFTTSPLYSRTGAGAYHQNILKALAACGADLPVIEIGHWHRYPGIAEVLAQRLSTAIQWVSSANRSHTVVIFTAHSQPGSPKANADFVRSFTELAQTVADRADCKQWQMAYRSAGPASQKWLVPDVQDVIENIANQGAKAVVLCDLLSLTENIEVTFDFMEARLKAESCGLEFVSTEFPNDSSDYMEVLYTLIHERIIQTGQAHSIDC